jgi:integrase
MRRQPKGAGTVYQRRDRPGLWVVERRVRGQRSKQTFSSEEAARHWLGSATATTLFQGSGTLGEWLRSWSDNPRKRLEPRTQDFYRTMAARWIASPIAGRPLNNLYAEEIEDVLEAWSDELSRTTLTHLRRVLGTALNEALRRKLILVNPVAGVRVPGRVQPTRVRTIRLGENVIRALSDAWINHPYRLAFEVLVHTGLRPGELCGLDWSDINLKDLSLSVTRAVKSRRQAGRSPWYVGETKTASSARNIAFHEGLRPLFFQHYNAMGRPKSGWVFPSPRNPATPITPDYLSKAFRELVDAAGVSVRPGQDRSELRIYDLRALHATHLIANEADPVAVAARLGHTDVVSTFRRYTGVVEGRDRVIADAGRVWETRRAPKELKAPRESKEVGRARASAR